MPKMQKQNKTAVLTGTAVVLAVIMLSGIMVVRLGSVAAAASLTAFAGVLAAVPGLLRAVYGKGR